MMDFPWPVTDDELLLNNAMASLLAPYGEDDRKRIGDEAARLLLKAYGDGVRDEDVLVGYVATALALSRS
jgi:hypothetical protein